jgi:hypothetical protein
MHPSTSERLYVLFLFVVVQVTPAKLAQTWRVALPFRMSTKRNNPAALESLLASAKRLKQYLLSLLSWDYSFPSRCMIYATACSSRRRLGGRHFWSLELARYSIIGLLAVFIAFLLRWHILRRIESLRKIGPRFVDAS